MVGADETTEPWRPPKQGNFLQMAKPTEVVTTNQRRRRRRRRRRHASTL